jgi:hypothetical protein
MHMKRNAKSILVVAVVAIVIVFVAAVAVFRPSIRIEGRYELVGPEDPAQRMIIQGADVHLIREVLEQNPETINTPVYPGETLLDVAATRGREDVVVLLLDMGAHVDGYLGINPRAEEGFTPLTSAVNRGHVEIVRLLLEQGADPYLKRPSSISAYDSAKRATPEIRAIFETIPPQMDELSGAPAVPPRGAGIYPPVATEMKVTEMKVTRTNGINLT